MFWTKAHNLYSDINENDSDIKKYFSIMDKIQSDGYEGIMGRIQDIGHQYIAKHTAEHAKILEIGFGKGRSFKFFSGDIDQYYPLDINENYVNHEVWDKYINASIGSATSLPFQDEYFDKVVSIYNLEHIEEIDQALQEISRVLHEDGEFIIALPCEDGLAWNLGRELTSRRVFTKKYGINYDKVIAFEHRHNLVTILTKLKTYFVTKEEHYYPFLIPSKDINLIYTAIYTKIPNV